MAVKITIESALQEGRIEFSRTIEIHRFKDGEAAENEWDRIHTYEARMTGGRYVTKPVHFRHRFGDPLHTLMMEALLELEKEDQADRSIYERQGVAA